MLYRQCALLCACLAPFGDVQNAATNSLPTMEYGTTFSCG